MAPRKVRKRPSQKKVKGTATNAVDDTTALGDVGDVHGPITPFRSIHGPVDGEMGPITSFRSIHGHRIWVDRSSGIVPTTVIDISKPRANSIPTAELNDLAEKQLLAELDFTIPDSRRVRKFHRRLSTHNYESDPGTGLWESLNTAVRVIYRIWELYILFDLFWAWILDMPLE